ncbi:5315_t:CDS:2 [Diversispora eburnea]|uniref:5315_t:CDS:1 n=1 Tax=Diversispora eburnea TaxID=1213867 RepID=A0A9N9AK53_9GLOM|nr:5315_t:CDS:2 [Diversispora eburnea]
MSITYSVLTKPGADEVEDVPEKFREEIISEVHAEICVVVKFVVKVLKETLRRDSTSSQSSGTILVTEFNHQDMELDGSEETERRVIESTTKTSIPQKHSYEHSLRPGYENKLHMLEHVTNYCDYEY